MVIIFGIIYSFFVSIGLINHEQKNKRENKKNKVKYRHPDGLTYIDIKGCSRLISTDEYVSYSQNMDGDNVLRNKHGKIIRNFSEEERNLQMQNNKEKAKINGETTYCISNDRNERSWDKKGIRFIDFDTGNVYLIRRMYDKWFYYMDFNTGMLVRKTDWQIKEDQKILNRNDISEKEKLKRIANIDIEDFNKAQMELINKGEITPYIFRNIYYYRYEMDYK